MVEQWIEEVLFRGRPPSGPGSEEKPRFHVVFGIQDDDPLTPGQKVRKTIGPVGAARAAEMGYTPLGLVEKINIAAFQHAEGLEAQIAAKDRLLEEGAAALAAASAELKAVSARVAALEVENSQMRALLADAGAVEA